MSYQIKQVILYRKDLNMRKGKIAAQVAHASMKVLLDRAESGYARRFFDGFLVQDSDDATSSGDPCFVIFPTEEMKVWINGRFAKIVLTVDDEESLLKAYHEALSANLPASLITDSGLTEFHGIPTNTTVAIGPAKVEDIDKITGKNGIISTKLS